MIVYDFGAGYCRDRDARSVDIDPETRPDIVADITGNTGIEAGSADEIRCNHVLEHLPHPRQFYALQEICRVLKPGGRFTVRVPHPSCDSAMVPGHVQILAPHYWRDIQARPHAYMGCALVIDAIEEHLNARGQALAQRFGLEPAEVLATFRNVCSETLVLGHKVSP